MAKQTQKLPPKKAAVTKRAAAKRSKRHQKVKKHVWMLFVPHKINSFRPRAIGRYGAVVIVAIAIVMQLAYNYTKTGLVLGRVSTVTPAALLAETNAERHENNLAPLTLNKKLSDAAAEKANDMLQKNYWSHDAPDGTKPWVWIDKTGYAYKEAGENLAKNFTTARSTVSAWIASPSHRDNVLKSEYTEAGFASVDGMFKGEPTTITVAFYGEPASSAVVLANAPQSEPELYAPTPTGPISITTRIGLGLQSLTPAAVTALALLFIATTIAVVSHFYRSKLPKRQRESWMRHHAIVKSSGFFAVAAFIILLYGGGSL